MKTSYFPSKYHTRVFYIACAFLLCILILKGQSGNKPSKGIGKVILSDTTKPKQINHKYKLTGSDTLFQILLTRVYSPEDITIRQFNALQTWLNKNIVADTLKTK